ncbi:hypothetical protein CYMTET_46501 [Cymbomonas tetramitiformis]|uniref:Uncharacterized protein n=1 Tax=Cymbomonas tetramitiformis TaxID=36881 RepID=A0AAE0BY10_9CHLO|nr:hypothetical protein CYMTET_46501 [Cymbomonas tetramitiformis]
MAALENANDRKALKGTIPGRQLHPGRGFDERPGICENLLREQEAAPGSELRQGSYTRHLSKTIESSALPLHRRHRSQRRRFTVEQTAARVTRPTGTSWTSWTVATTVVSFLAILRKRSALRRKAARWPAATLVAVARWSGHIRRKEALSTLPSDIQELEAAATLADIVQGLGLQYFCRERDLDGYKKRLFGLAGSANIPWGRAIRSSPQLKSVLSQDWALLLPPEYHLADSPTLGLAPG